MREISYNPKTDDVPMGMVHDFQYKEGAFIPGFLNPRRTHLSEPLDDFFFTQSYDEVMGTSRKAGKGQASGVLQVGEAVTQMDQATQQNAALVEEMAAAASSLKTQATDLVEAVAVFRLDGQAPLPRAAVRAGRSYAKPLPGDERRHIFLESA